MKFDRNRRRKTAAEQKQHRELAAALVDRQDRRAAEGLQRCWTRRATALRLAPGALAAEGEAT